MTVDPNIEDTMLRAAPSQNPQDHVVGSGGIVDPSRAGAVLSETGLSFRPSEARVFSPIEEAVNNIARRRNSSLANSLASAAGTNADANAEMQRLGFETGLDLGTVSRNLARVQKITELRRLREYRLASQYPILAHQMSDPDFAAIAHDDLKSLSTIERIFDAFETGGIQYDLEILGNRAAWGEDTRDTWNQIRELERRAEELRHGHKGFLESAATIAGQMSRTIPEAAAAGIAVGVVYAGWTALAGQAGPQAAIPEEAVTVPGAFALGFTHGSIPVFAYSAYRMEAGNAYIDMINSGYDKDSSLYASVGVGTANAALELLGVKFAITSYRMVFGQAIRDQMLKKAGKLIERPTTGRLLRDVAFGGVVGVAGETGTEFSQEIVSIIGEEIARSYTPGQLQSKFSTHDGLHEVGARISEVFFETVKGMTVLGVFGMATHGMFGAARIERSKREGEFFEKIDEAVKESKLAGRSPRSLSQYIARTATDGTKTIYIDAEELTDVLAKSGLTIEQIDQALPGVRAQLNDAKKAGGSLKGIDVTISTAEYAANAARTDLGTALKPHLRLSADSVSSAARPEAIREHKEAEAAFLKRAEEIEKSNDATAESARVVQDRMKAQLKAAMPGISEDDAETASMFHRAYVVTQAAEEGLTPEEWQKRYDYTVTGVGTANVLADGRGSVQQAPAQGSFEQASRADLGLGQQAAPAPDSGVFDANNPPVSNEAIFALMDADGKIYYDINATMHGDLVETFPDIAEFVIDGGFIVNGKYMMGKSDGGYSAFEGEQKQIDAVRNFTEQANTQGFQESNYRPAVVAWAKEKFGDRTAPDGSTVWQNFVEWFGDSKVVDDAGQPVTMYHGTAAARDFKEFKVTKDFGFHFSPSPQAANKAISSRVGGTTQSGGARIIPAHLSIKNPLRVEEEIHMFNTGSWQFGSMTTAIGRLVSRGKSDIFRYEPASNEFDEVDGKYTKPLPRTGKIDKTAREYESEIYQRVRAANPNASDKQINRLELAEFVKDLKAIGHDGIIYANRVEGGGDSWVAFDSTQIKSTNNQGQYGQTNPNTLEQASVAPTSMPSVKTSNPVSPIGKAMAAIPSEGMESIGDSETFFKRVWKKILIPTGTQVKSLSDKSVDEAAKLAVADIQEFVARYNKYADYYSQDWKQTRRLLDDYAGRPITDDEFQMFRVISGLTSPNTKLPANISDTVKLWTHWMDNGSFDGFLLGPKPVTGSLVVMESDESISGTTANIKIRTIKIVATLAALAKKHGSVKAAMDYLQEPVSVKELHDVNKALGYSGNVSNIGNIQALVKMATGQDELIPRMFIFGQKVGAYALNSIGDERYTTVDIWESRYIRSFFQGMFAKEIGLPADGREHDLFVRFSYAFRDEMERVTGRSWTPSSLQAMRWFYIIAATRAAGYSKASTSETISTYTERVLQKEFDYGQRQTQAGKTTSTPIRRVVPKQFERDVDADLDEQGITDPKQRRTITVATWVQFARSNSVSDPVGFQFDADRSGLSRRSGALAGLATVATHNPGPRLVDALKKAGANAKPYVELEPTAEGVKAFSARVRAVNANSKFGTAVYVYSDAEYMGKRLFLSESGKSGFALSPDGDIVSVFSESGSHEGRGAMVLATQMGGTKLDCFDTALPGYYAAHGFRAVARVPWNDEYTPKGWDFETFSAYNNGRPDVVFMVYDASYTGTYNSAETAPGREYQRLVGKEERRLKSEVKEAEKAGIPFVAPTADQVSAKDAEMVEESKKAVADGSVVANPTEAVGLQTNAVAAEASRVAANAARYERVVRAPLVSFAPAPAKPSVTYSAAERGFAPVGARELAEDIDAEFGEGFTQSLEATGKFKFISRRDVGDISGAMFSSKADRLRATGGFKAWVDWADRNKRADFGKIKSLDDANAVAEEQYSKIITETPAFSPQAYMESLDDRDINLYPENLRPAIRAWRQGDKDAGISQILEAVADMREDNIHTWKRYLEEINEEISEDPLFRNYVAYELFESFSASDPGVGPPFNAAALAGVHGKFKDGFAPNFERAYQAELLAVTANTVQIGDAQNGWRKVPKTGKSSPQFDERVRDVQSISHSTWCTKSYNAAPYIQEGDFWVYIDNGKPALAIRFRGDQVAEIQGRENNGTIPHQYADKVNELVDSGKISLSDEQKRELKKSTEKAVLVRQLTKDAKEIDPEELKANIVPMRSGTEYKAYQRADGSIVIIGDVLLLYGANKITDILGNADIRVGVSAPALTSISGDAYIHKGASVPALTSVGGYADIREGASVPALTSVGGNAYIREGVFPALTSISGDATIREGVSVPALTSVGGSAYISVGVSVPALTSIGGYADIREGVSVPALTSIGGYADIREGVSVPALTSVGGYADIREGASVPALTSVGGNAYIRVGASVPALTSVGGNAYIRVGASVPALTSIGGDATIYEGASVPALTSIGGNANIFEGASVPALTSVGGSANISEGVSVNDQLRYGLGEARALQRGIELAAEAKRYDRYSISGDIQAFVKDGVVYIVSDSIAVGTSVKGLMLHEIGNHLRQLGVGDKQFRKILSDFKSRSKSDKRVRAAYERVPANTAATNIDEEALGYYLEENPNLTITKKFLAWVREALRSLGDKLFGADRSVFMGWADKLTNDDLVLMATASVRSAPQEFASAQTSEEALFQAAPAGGPRGEFNPKTLTTRLLHSADLSTYLHETGHFFLEQLMLSASKPNASDRVKAQAQAILDWFGIKDVATWNAMTLNQQRTHHEAFAYNFEVYLFEGKSPSVEMRSAFEKFKIWLKEIYKSIQTINDTYRREFGTDLPVMTSEIRQVMDRMMATDEQIARAESQQSMMGTFQTQEESGMEDARWAAYQEMLKEAREAAVTDLTVATLKQMQWLSRAEGRLLKELQAKNEEKRKEIRAEVSEEVRAMPVYMAIELLKKGQGRVLNGEYVIFEGKEIKLDIEAVRALVAPEMMAKFGRGKYGMVAANGTSPELVAGMFGFSSGDELVRAIIDAKPINELIDSRTDMRMLFENGDMNTAEQQKAAVQRALHNEARARFIAVELKFLASATHPVRAMVDAARSVARQIIGRKRIKDLRPHEHIAAEGRAAKEAWTSVQAVQTPDTAAKTAYTRKYNEQIAAGADEATAIADATKAAAEAAERADARVKAHEEKNKGTSPAEAALKAKQTEMLQHHLATAAMEAKESVVRGIKYLRNVLSDKSVQKMGADYADQIAALLDRFELRRITQEESARRQDLSAWAEAQKELGLDPDLSPAMVKESNRKSYTEMTVDEFNELLQTVKLIEHIGRNKSKVMAEAKAAEFADKETEIEASIRKHSRGRTSTARSPTTGTGRALKSIVGFFAAHFKAAAIARILDGGEDNGPVWNYLIRSANEAGDLETSMRAAATKALTDILAPFFRGGNMGGAGRFFPSIGRSLNRESVLAIALNCGNAGNLQRLLDGEGWTIEQIRPILETLTSEEAEAVQEIWNYVGSFRPQIAAKSRRLYGKEPDWVDPQPLVINTSDGKTVSLEGGYYPIRYDPVASQRAESLSEAEAAKDAFKGAHVSATTRRSFTKRRADEVKGRPLLYTLSGLFGGVNEVIHDLSWHDWLIGANKLMRSEKVDRAIRDTYGPDAKKSLVDWIKDVAVGDSQMTSAGERALGFLRQNISAVGLGYKAMSAAMQVTGFAQSSVRIGSSWLIRGLASSIANPGRASREANERSSFMRNRARTQFRELNELRNMVQDETLARRTLRAHTYLLMMKMQRLVDVPTWWGAYEKAISVGEDEETSVALADQAVIDSQGSGQIKDLAAIERGGPALKLFTVFYGFMNTLFNVAAVQTMTAKSRGKLAADMVMLFVVPVVVGRLIRDALTPDDDDDKDYLSYIARQLIEDELSYLMGTMMIVREFDEVGKILSGGEGYGYSGPSGLRAIGDVGKFVNQARQLEFDRSFRQSAINVLGDFTGLPAGQINATIDGVTAVIEGDTASPLAPVFGFKKVIK